MSKLEKKKKQMKRKLRNKWEWELDKLAAAASQPLPNHWQFLATKQTDNVLTRIIYKKNRQNKQTNKTKRQRPHENNLQTFIHKSEKSVRYILSGFFAQGELCQFHKFDCILYMFLCICVNHTRIILRYVTITILRLCVMRW